MRWFTVAAVLGGLAAGAAVPLPAMAEVRTPAVPAGLTAGVEKMASYVPQAACDPVTRPGAVAFGKLLVATYPGTSFGVTRACGGDGGTSASEHYEGRAIDWMVSAAKPAQKAQAQKLLKWLLATDAQGNKYAMARRLGVMYLIWDKKIFGLYRAQDGWRPYACSGVTACHSDHIHISLTWAGAMKRTSYWTNKTAAADYGPCRVAGLNWAAPYRGANPAPCGPTPRATAPAGASKALRGLVAYSGAQVGPGSTGPVVSAVQTALGLEADGAFGKATRAAVAAFQKSHGLAGSGVVNQDTWRALLAAAPKPAPKPAPAPPAGDGASPLAKYVGKKLRVGSKGKAVAALQGALGMKADGRFGIRTRNKVKKFQKAHGLKATGVVNARTWRALGA